MHSAHLDFRDVCEKFKVLYIEYIFVASRILLGIFFLGEALIKMPGVKTAGLKTWF